MSIYDNLILHRRVNVDLPIDPTWREDRDNHRLWQTKDLNPSMDIYAILPYPKRYGDNVVWEESESDDFYLYRRSPPVVEWTEVNEGAIGEGYSQDLLRDADHWRQVRYTGDMEITDVSDDGVMYDLKVSLSNGKLTDIRLSGSKSIESGINPPE